MEQTTPSGGGGGHPVMGAIFGLLLGVFLGMDLLLAGAFRVDSVMLYLLPLLGLLAGVGLGLWAPIRLGRS